MRHATLVAFLVVLVAAAVAAPGASAATGTVGDFLVDVAALRHLHVSDGASAAAALRSNGVLLPELDLASALTEADVVSIGRALGIHLTTSRPGDRFDTSRVASFLTSFRGEIGASSGDQNRARGEDGDSPNDPPGPYPRPDNAADPATKGKGKKKGLQSPCDPR